MLEDCVFRPFNVFWTERMSRFPVSGTGNDSGRSMCGSVQLVRSVPSQTKSWSIDRRLQPRRKLFLSEGRPGRFEGQIDGQEPLSGSAQWRSQRRSWMLSILRGSPQTRSQSLCRHSHLSFQMRLSQEWSQTKTAFQHLQRPCFDLPGVILLMEAGNSNICCCV